MPPDVMEWIENVLLGILALLVILGIPFLLVWIQEAGRRKKLRAIATALGATFQPQETPAERESRSAQSQPASDGYVVSLTNIIEIAETGEVSIKLFDYFFSVSMGKDVSTGKKDRMSCLQTAFLVQSPRLNLPEFVLRPKTFPHKVGEAAGLQDINLPESAEFSKTFTVQGKEEAAIRGVFTPAVIGFCQAHPGIVLEGCGDRLLFYRYKEEVGPNAIRTFLEEGKQLTARISEALRL
jgi:hypothetical protein